jgi:hypothetical protein
MKQSEFNFDAVAFRQELMNLPLTPAWENLNPPKLADIHVPQMHSKALAPEVSIVEGMRGAGKSFWTAVLFDDKARNFVLGAAKIAGSSDLIVRVGFGLDASNEQFPSAKRIASLMIQSCTPDDIWRAVLVRHALKALDKSLPFGDSVDSAAHWVKDHSDKADNYLTECDRDLSRQGRVLLLLFDSLERLADDWGRIREILSAALKLCLECRTRRAIRFKFFLRPDMIEEEDEIWRFADSSKLLPSKVPLQWRPNDLFGLILLHLANSQSVGEGFRKMIQSEAHIQWQEIEGVYPLPRSLTVGEQPLRSMVESLAGPWVGATASRGFTFKWIPTHLSDAKGRLSPRSILLAIRRAAEWTDERHPNHKFALHYEGVQQGVVEASKIRIGEIKEDYPWVGPLLDALKGVTVPLTFKELAEKWTKSCVQASLDIAHQSQRLPPRRYSSASRMDDLDALVDDLVELAVLYRTEDKDKRYNMPDIFRVGFGIKRKGGVRPPR